MSKSRPRMSGMALIVVALFAFAIPGVAHAASDDLADSYSVQLDSARSQGSFHVKVMWLLGITGRFGALHGHVHFDAFRNHVSVDARVEVASIRMGNARYEEWVKSPEFFDAARYPQIEFASEAIPRSRLREGGDLPGMLSLHGVRQPVRFQLQASTCARPAWDCPIEVAGMIRRSAFGMRAHHATLGDKVELRFEVYASAPAHGDLPPLPPPA